MFPRTPRNTGVYTCHPTFVRATSGVLTQLPAKLSKNGMRVYTLSDRRSKKKKLRVYTASEAKGLTKIGTHIFYIFFFGWGRRQGLGGGGVGGLGGGTPVCILIITWASWAAFSRFLNGLFTEHCRAASPYTSWLSVLTLTG